MFSKSELSSSQRFNQAARLSGGSCHGRLVCNADSAGAKFGGHKPDQTGAAAQLENHLVPKKRRSAPGQISSKDLSARTFDISV